MAMVGDLMRQRTLPVHRRVERQLALLDDGLSVERLAQVLQAFYGFWVGNEGAVEVWAQADPILGAELRWPRRKRAGMFAQDLATLGVPRETVETLPRSVPVFDPFWRTEVFGWLYVTEGSTLGGALINRHLSQLPALSGLGLGCFSPYTEGPMSMWLSYKTLLQRFVSDDGQRIAAVVDAAAATFDALECWLTAVVAET
jgi:heme oxygenase (biliverdin-IX-beta and delta-forming)